GPDTGGLARLNGSLQSTPSSTAMMHRASSGLSANNDGQSSDRQAGTIPCVDQRPRVGLTPMRLLNAAGTRPEPAVSVPSEKVTSPSATATAEPALEPPLIYAGSNA